MAEVSGTTQPQFRAIIYNGATIGIQLDFNIVIRIYMKSATPQRFGVRILRELPDILKQEDVRKTLGIPEFDKAIIKESTHSPLEADLTLIKNKNIACRLSVKASPTGNLDYIAKSWRNERTNLDLLAIIPLEGRRNGEIVYYVAMIRAPKIIKSEGPTRIKSYLLSVIDAKREGESLERLWPTDFSEISEDIKVFAFLKKQDEILRKQDEILHKQDEILHKQDEILRKQEEFLEGQRESIKKFDKMIEILEKIYEKL